LRARPGIVGFIMPLFRSRRPFIALVALLAMPLPHHAADSSSPDAFARATFGGGCFWCTEAVFESEPGVKSVVSGYAGGHAKDPTYREVCSGDTGHAEVIQIEYDPAKVSFERLLELFWVAHDPTTLNRQGADAGTQYRSIILYHDDTQRAAAEKSKAAAQAEFDRRIVTEIVPLEKFYVAEKQHQDYFRNNREASYCRAVIVPKLKKLGRE
jgi:peptide-methionine (S)-S-oxide reductase